MHEDENEDDVFSLRKYIAFHLEMRYTESQMAAYMCTLKQIERGIRHVFARLRHVFPLILISLYGIRTISAYP